jgi:hypothetical protein
MTMIDKGGPAFPSGLIDPSTPQDAVQPIFPGMTLRDYFAAKAMAALYQSHYVYKFTGTSRAPEFQKLMDELAEDAYGIADSMLKAREA